MLKVMDGLLQIGIGLFVFRIVDCKNSSFVIGSKAGCAKV